MDRNFHVLGTGWLLRWPASVHVSVEIIGKCVHMGTDPCK
jgi:hypothetical protein